ncbi:MAG: EamA family transporter [Acidimicrobiia bacterium]|nr:EamA family transporter [Acidimicrobiia bacterium]
MSDSRSTTGVLLALTAAAMFGVSGAVAGGVFEDIDPARVAQSRSLIAATLLVGFAAWRGVLRPNGGVPKFALLGLNLALVNVTFYWAIDRLGVGPGATVQFLAPVLVLIWLAAVKGQAVSTTAWLAAAGAVLGVALVTQAWALGDSDFVGLAAGLASAALFAAYLIYGEYLGETYRPATLGAWGFLFASLFWLIVLPLWSFPFEAAQSNVLDLLIVGILGTAAPFILEFAALSMASSGVIGIVATAEPPIGAVAAWVILDQQLEPIQWLGIAIVVIAVATVQRVGLSETHPATPIA